MLQSGGVSKESPVKGRFTNTEGSMGWRCILGAAAGSPVPSPACRGKKG